VEVGDKLRIVKMERKPEYIGRVGEVVSIDSTGQIYGTWGRCAIIPEKDDFIVIQRQLRPNDEIVCRGMKCTIMTIKNQEPWDWRDAYFIEFLDTDGICRLWNQKFDGGKAILH